MTTLEMDGWKAYFGAEVDNSEWPTAEIRPVDKGGTSIIPKPKIAVAPTKPDWTAVQLCLFSGLLFPPIWLLLPIAVIVSVFFDRVPTHQ